MLWACNSSFVRLECLRWRIKRPQSRKVSLAHVFSQHETNEHVVGSGGSAPSVSQASRPATSSACLRVSSTTSASVLRSTFFVEKQNVAESLTALGTRQGALSIALSQRDHGTLWQGENPSPPARWGCCNKAYPAGTTSLSGWLTLPHDFTD